MKNSSRGIRVCEEQCSSASPECIFYTLRESLLLLDSLQMIVLANRYFYQTYKLKRAEVEGRHLYDLFKNISDKTALKKTLRKIQNSDIVTFEFECDVKDIGHKIILLNTPMLSKKAYRKNCILLSVKDITHEKEIERQLAQSQKMEIIGRLTGEIVHDFNNLLTPILSLSTFMQSNFNKKSKIYQNLNTIKKAAQNGKMLVASIMTFIRQQKIAPEILNINNIIQSLEKLICTTVGEKINVTFILDPDLKYIKMAPVQIYQVILNLVGNAKDSMPNGGKITIKTANINFNANCSEKFINSDIPAGSYVMLNVSDTGKGMNNKTRSQIFDLYFTTKKDKGTGIGLATIYEIISQNKGGIFVRSKPGYGTNFEIFFPQIAPVFLSEKICRVNPPHYK